MMGFVDGFSAHMLSIQDGAAVATVATVAAADSMLVNKWSHWSVRTFMIITFTTITEGRVA